MDKIEELLTRGVSNIIPGEAELRKLLTSEKKLSIYLGIDPTATRIHLGHAVPLRKLQAFAELGHNVTFLIGDFTALVGDTSDKNTERPLLTSEQIQENFKTYKKQAEKILDFSKVTVRYNSEWLKKLNLADVIKLSQRFSMNDFISRELIRKRLQTDGRVGLHEVLYPMMQGYDSYFMDTDIQLGGTDQTFNMQAGRTLQKILRDKESFIMSNVFLEGTDGRKMSKSWGNAIWLDDIATDMYAKVMSINDELLEQYFLLGTNISLSEVEKIKQELKNNRNPMQIKKNCARKIVSELHNEEAAKEAEENFKKTVQEKEMPQNVEEVTLPKELQEGATLADILSALNLAASKSEAKRLIEQGGVTVDNEVIIDPNTAFVPKEDTLIKVGKRKFVKIKV